MSNSVEDRLAASGRFLSAAADRDRVPVVLLAGCLGSGKTTLLNGLLQHPALADTAVAVNEFGSVPLDQYLIDHGPDRTVVFANGCLCCSLAGDMEAGVMRLFSRRDSGAVPRFARLIMELSGLADPAPVAQAILRNPVLSRLLRLEAIITTVDAQFSPTQLRRCADARKQVALADLLVVTKPDLVGEAGVGVVAAELRWLNPLAPVQVVRNGAVAAANILPPAFFDPASAAPRRSGLSAETVIEPAVSDHATRITAVSLTIERALAWRPLEGWLRMVRLEHAEQLLRVKAMLRIAGAAGPVVLHGLHHVLHPPVQLERWPDEARRSRLLLVVEAPVADAIRASWHAALPRMLAGAVA